MRKIFFINLIMALFMIVILSMNSELPATASNSPGTKSHFGSSDYYIAPDGSDRNPGTAEKPWKTIQKAADTVSPGSTVHIKGGTYYERISINVSGTEEEPILFTGFNNEKVVIDGSQSAPSDQEDIIRISNQNYIQLTGLEIVNNENQEDDFFITGIGIWGKGKGIEIRNCSIHHIWYTGASKENGAHAIGVYGQSGEEPISGLIIDGNEIWDIKCGSSETVALNGNVDGFEFTNNYVHDTNNIGLDMIGDEPVCPVTASNRARNGFVGYNRMENVSCETNPCYPKNDYSADGIYVDGGKDIVIAYNTCTGNDIGIEVENEKPNQVCSGIIVRDNLIFGNKSCGIAVGGYDQTRGWAVDCRFLNNTLYGNDTKKLGRGEICIGKSHDITFENNIVYTGAKNLAVGTESFGAAYIYDISLNNNLYYGPGGARGLRFSGVNTGLVGLNMWKKKTGQDLSSRIADPKFADAAKNNFHLTRESPAINFGNPSYSAVDLIDFEGNPRKSGRSVDCGAFEFGQ